MKRVLLFVTLPLAIIAIALLASVNSDRLSAPEMSFSGGSEFYVDGTLVDAAVDPYPRKVQRDDSLIFTLRLQPESPSPSPAPDDVNETNGTLTPTLTAPDCSVTPLGGLQTLPTQQATFDAFVWTWSVDSCKEPGDKALLLALAYVGNKGDEADSDPRLVEGVAYVDFSDGPSWGTSAQVVGVITSFLAALAPFVPLVLKRMSKDAPG